MNTAQSNQVNFYYATPQFRKRSKSQQVDRLNRLVFLFKKQLKKHKDETSLDLAHLNHINSISKNFSQKILGQLGKCQQLKQTELKSHKNKIKTYESQQKQIQSFEIRQNIYNLDCLNSKPILNCQILQQQTPQKKQLPITIKNQQEQNPRKNLIQNVRKRFSTENCKNTSSIQKIRHNYLKEIFLTSIILILFGLLVRQILHYM